MRDINPYLRSIWDVAVAVAILPVILLLAILVAFENKGSVFFTQTRLDERGRKFRILKFRTMVANPEEILDEITSRSEPRVTPLGRLMRDTSLDELPQFFNVLRGSLTETNQVMAGPEKNSGAWLIDPPGLRADRILRFVFSKKAHESIFSQIIADMREEHAEALFANESKKAWWIVVRGHIGLILAIIAYLGATVLKKISGVWTLLP